MKVVVVGSGGREHALALALGRTAEVVVTPGNPGIAGSVATPVEELAAAGDVDLVVVGPEQPLVDGLADRLRAAGVRVFGPGADGAQVEGSKAYLKELLVAAGVPTARYGAFDDVDAALAFLDDLDGGYVIKTDGLAAGKGVLVTTDRAEAAADVRAKLAGDAFGDAGRTVVVEELLEGPEVSVFAVCDGTRTVCLPAAQDFKRVGDGDAGPNTGGMGAWSPLPFAPDDLAEVVARDFVEPTLAELRRRGIDFRGVLYAGLMLTREGPKLIEYNCRFGDPECQVLMMRLESDLAEFLLACAQNRLAALEPPRFSDDTAMTVVMAANGYPGTPEKGGAIHGIEQAEASGAQVFHAGTARGTDGTLVASGGRVLNVTAMAETVSEAQKKAYKAVDLIDFPSGFCRRDIGWREVERENAGG